MANLTLNSWTVPILDGSGSYTTIPVGERTQAFDGTPLLTRNGLKRQWDFQTKQLDWQDASGLAGMINGQGDHLRFTKSTWSSKGLYPSSSPTRATITPSVDLQTTPADIYDEASGNREAKYGDGSLWMGPATTNLLSEVSSNAESAPTGYTALVGATLASDPTYILQGTKSLKITTAASAYSGARVNATGYTPGNKHTGYVYVYTTEALSMRLIMRDGVGSNGNTFTSVANAWVRVEVSLTLDAAASYCALDLEHVAATAGKIIYADMWQVEEQDYGTPWIVGGTSRGNPALTYTMPFYYSQNSLTFACWLRAPSTLRTADESNICYIFGKEGSYIWFRRDSDTNLIAYFTRYGGSTANVSYTSSPFDGDWHHLALVFDAHQTATYNTRVHLYYDGTLVDSETNSASYPVLQSTSPQINIGTRSSARAVDGRINEVMILPFAMSTAQIAALAGRTTEIPAWPRLEALGDTIAANDYQPEVVEGLPGQIEYAPGVDSGTYKSYLRKVSFGLRSVGDV